MNNYGEKKRKPLVIIASWTASLLSLVLVYGAASALVNALLSFRSCDKNDTGLSVVSCGKESITSGDALLIVLTILTVLLSLSLFTGAIRASRGKKRV